VPGMVLVVIKMKTKFWSLKRIKKDPYKPVSNEKEKRELLRKLIEVINKNRN